ncbi:MAG TPA: efflux transporter outer membrane subunit, partial [Orrella sp.]
MTGSAAGVLTVALTVALAGCTGLGAVGPDYQKPEMSLPDQWQDSAQSDVLYNPDLEPPLSQWWHQFGDPDLDWLIETALKDDLSIAQAQARLNQARASRAQAVSALYPEIGTSVRATPTFYGAPESERPDTTQYDAEFDAAWEIDIFGGTRRAIEAAQAATEASEAALGNIRVSVAAEVAQNYVDLRNSQARLSIAKRNLASQAETLQIAQWRHQAGLARQTDVAQARASLEQTRASLPDLEIELARANNRLSVLTGQAPGAVNERLSSGRSTDRSLPSLPNTIATGIPTNVLTQRPDLREAERNLAAETARVGQVTARRYPSLNLGGSIGWTAFTLSGIGPADSLIGVLAGTLGATLFDGGRLRSEVDAQTAVQEQALFNYEQTVLQALEEVENALISHALSRQRVQAWASSAQASASAAQ